LRLPEPVLVGDGVPYFGKRTGAPLQLGDPKVIEGTGVTHLLYSVSSA
jgi:hypothetical protein